jgi:hypothetical protein
MTVSKLIKHSAVDSGTAALLSESRRLLEESKSKDICVVKPGAQMSPEINEIFENLSGAVLNYQEKVKYDIMKYQLANKALNTALWDMEVVAGDPVNPNNTFIWSDDFRKMLGFTDKTDFPDKLNSWSDRLHPEDKEAALNAFAGHMLDFSGKTPFDVKYRLKLKDGSYGYFRATGDTMRDETGKPLRVAGLLLDLAEERKLKDLDKQLMEKVKHDTEFVGNMTRLVNDFDESIDSQTQAVEESSHKIEHMLASLKHVSEISSKEQESITSLLNNAGRVQEAMMGTKQSVQNISQLVEGISSAIQIISSIAANTNLLSMNAAIEAAHAGGAGKGFAVVADEIRRLSESTRTNSVDISKTLKNIIHGISVTSKQSDETDRHIVEIANEIGVFAGVIRDIINTFARLSDESHEIAVVFDKLKKQTATFKTGYADMVSINKQLVSTMNDIATTRAA